MAIPKIIHYCWFGGNEYSELFEKCYASWKKYCPDYEIKVWNENNFDVHCCRYVEEAYEAKKWAFVSDYARFYILWKEGGIYLDTDIELLKSFDDLLNDDVFFGFGRKGLTLPVFGARREHNLFRLILNDYNERKFKLGPDSFDTTTIEWTASRIMEKHYGLVLDGKEQLLNENIHIYPQSFFSSTNWETGIITRNPDLYVIHYAEGSWMSGELQKEMSIRRKMISIFGEKLGFTLGTAVYLLKRDGFAKMFMHAHSFLRRKCATPFMKICRIIRKSPRKIVCENFGGKGYGDNPKYIVEELLKRGKYDIVWIVDKNTKYSFPKGIRTVPIGTFRELYELATAKIWIDNNRKELFIHKGNDQYYIQTWHGFYSLKKIERDAEQTLLEEYVKAAIHDGAMTDLMMASCEDRKKLYLKSFWYDGEVMECGSPRNDIFFKKGNFSEKVRKTFNITRDKKIVLYAPTFRDNHDISSYNLDYDSLCDSLEKKFGGEWICLIKLHPAISYKKNQLNFTSRAIDATDYSDIQELFLTSDVLVTDYSDCMFEFSLTYKPVFLYTADLDEYKSTRDFYYDIRDLHYSISLTQDELEQAIAKFDEGIYRKETEEFLKRIGSYETGNASRCVADRIDKVIGGIKE